MQHHKYDHAPAGWSGYITGAGWILFYADDDNNAYLHRE